MTKNIMIVGVGGQGSLLASKLLGHLLLSEGYDVKEFVTEFACKNYVGCCTLRSKFGMNCNGVVKTSTAIS